MNVVYANYWERKRLLAGPVPQFPLRRWWPTDGLCDIERVYFDAIRSAPRLLDIGAGDLRVMRKLLTAGFAGEYHTQDIGGEHGHTFRSLDEVTGTYDAILCLDVIEHLPLEQGLSLLVRAVSLLAAGGVLILQTPNARCVRNPMAWDMTHLHLYNLPDLWAFCIALGLDAGGYRVALGTGPRPSLGSRLIEPLRRFVVARLLGCDYADNIALIARKPLP